MDQVWIPLKGLEMAKCNRLKESFKVNIVHVRTIFIFIKFPVIDIENGPDNVLDNERLSVQPIIKIGSQK